MADANSCLQKLNGHGYSDGDTMIRFRNLIAIIIEARVPDLFSTKYLFQQNIFFNKQNIFASMPTANTDGLVRSERAKRCGRHKYACDPSWRRGGSPSACSGKEGSALRARRQWGNAHAARDELPLPGAGKAVVHAREETKRARYETR